MSELDPTKSEIINGITQVTTHLVLVSHTLLEFANDGEFEPHFENKDTNDLLMRAINILEQGTSELHKHIGKIISNDSVDQTTLDPLQERVAQLKMDLLHVINTN